MLEYASVMREEGWKSHGNLLRKDSYVADDKEYLTDPYKTKGSLFWASAQPIQHYQQHILNQS